MLLPLLLQNLSASNNTVFNIFDAAIGSESVSVQHDLSALFPTGSGQRNFKLSKIALAIQEATQAHRYNLNASSIQLAASDYILPKAHGSNDVAQSKELANVSVEAGWQDKAIAVDAVTLAIEADMQELALGESLALIDVESLSQDLAIGFSHIDITKQLSESAIQAQTLYVMGFFS